MPQQVSKLETAKIYKEEGKLMLYNGTSVNEPE